MKLKDKNRLLCNFCRQMEVSYFVLIEIVAVIFATKIAVVLEIRLFWPLCFHKVWFYILRTLGFSLLHSKGSICLKVFRSHRRSSRHLTSYVIVHSRRFCVLSLERKYLHLFCDSNHFALTTHQFFFIQ